MNDITSYELTDGEIAVARGDWRVVMPVWAHKELWYLRSIWYGPDGPVGDILEAVLINVPEHTAFEDEPDGGFLLPEITYCVAMVRCTDGVVRPIALYNPNDYEPGTVGNPL